MTTGLISVYLAVVAAVALLTLCPQAIGQEQKKQTSKSHSAGGLLNFLSDAWRDRQRLKEAIHRNNDAIDALNNRDGATAEALLKENLKTFRELYPSKDYPDGKFYIATTLRLLGVAREYIGDYYAALQWYEQSLDMMKRLYPPKRYPKGHQEIVQILVSKGDALGLMGRHGQAVDTYRAALVMLRQLDPNQRRRDARRLLALVLNDLAIAVQNQGRFEAARRYLEQALETTRESYPPESYPDGDGEIVTMLTNLGNLLQSQGETEQGRQYVEEAVEMSRRLYAHAKSRGIHLSLAFTLKHLARMLQEQHKYDDAAHALNEALTILQQEYPADHPAIVATLENVAVIHLLQGKLAESHKLMARVLDARRKIYDRAHYPKGHPRLVEAMTNLALLRMMQGDFPDALDYGQQALVMSEKLFPKDQYPHGHWQLARALSNVAMDHLVAERYDEAFDYFTRAANMEYELGRELLPAFSEGEMLNFVSRRFTPLDGLLSAYWHGAGSARVVYRQVWRRTGLVYRILAARQRILANISDEEQRKLYLHYLAIRRRLAMAALGAVGSWPDTSAMSAASLRQLTKQKEELERELAASVSGIVDGISDHQGELDALIDGLDSGPAFVHLTRWSLFSRKPGFKLREGQQWLPRYMEFILQRGQPVTAIDLGSADRIDAALVAWRRQILERASGVRDSKRLRRMVWAPVEQVLRAGTNAIVICPDGALTAVPWAALPGRSPHSYLLHDYTIWTMPHGRRLTPSSSVPQKSAPEAESPDQVLLTVGNVDYGPLTLGNTRETERGPDVARVGTSRTFWKPLPETAAEIQAIRSVATGRSVRQLTGSEASVAHVLDLLPRVRIAHFATHGFFVHAADGARGRTANGHLSASLSLPPRAERTTTIARNPLVLSGIVLAHANDVPGSTAQDILPAQHMLTGEMIAGLPLRQLDLVVLSACDTGMGEIAIGEGVFGLQRAFHLAGAHSVIASLWKVEDAATRQLMTLFYQNLWLHHMTKADALRQAQLAMLRSFDPQKGTLRAGFVYSHANEAKIEEARKQLRTETTMLPPFYWAAFTLSGTGQ